MAKRAKRPSLPRVTVLAMSKRELQAFCDAVERLRHLVHDLGGEIDRVKSLPPGKRARKPLGTSENGKGFNPVEGLDGPS